MSEKIAMLKKALNINGLDALNDLEQPDAVGVTGKQKKTGVEQKLNG